MTLYVVSLKVLSPQLNSEVTLLTTSDGASNLRVKKKFIPSVKCYTCRLWCVTQCIMWMYINIYVVIDQDKKEVVIATDADYELSCS